ncbi:MAG: glycosyltransferase family 9 protein [Candidatus Latescibacteria bacterium]|nr:glycosyltransferase family 9 protein [Candidatus Latescibacterota bacterium]
MRLTKHLELFFKHKISKLIGLCLNTTAIKPEDIEKETITQILLIRQDSRLGNLLLMTPLISSLHDSFPDAKIDLLISEGFEDVLRNNSCINRLIVFEKQKARLKPWSYVSLLRSLQQTRYDCAVDVYDGHHFSLNNVLLTGFSGARYKIGYDRKNARSFFNVLVPVLPEDTHMADALLGLGQYLSSELRDYPMHYDVLEEDRMFANNWLRDKGIAGLDSFFIIHPGGKGSKKWGLENFSELIDILTDELGVRIVVIGGSSEKETIETIRENSKSEFDILQNITIGQMAAVIERCDLFISGDTGPMHLSVSLDRPTVAIFIKSDFRVYGPRGPKSRIVLNRQGMPATDDVMNAVNDLFNNPVDLC